MISRSFQGISVVSILLMLFVPTPCAAYVGPGAGLTAIGAFLAVLLGLVVAVFGFIWYPIKRFLRKRRKPDRWGDGAPEQ